MSERGDDRSLAGEGVTMVRRDTTDAPYGIAGENMC
jgi:hypothetical protein